MRGLRLPRLRGPRSAFGRWTAWLLVVAFLSAALLELTLRLLSLLPWQTPLFVSDPDIGFRFRPGVNLRGDLTNSLGYNDSEPAPRRAGDPPRIGLIGDSFVFGAVARELNLATWLERYLARDAEEAEVFNLGIPAAGPENYLRILRHDASRLELDVVGVVIFLGNDVTQSHPDFVTRVWFGAPRAHLRRPYLLRFSTDYFYTTKLTRSAWRTLAEPRKEDPGSFPEATFLAIERRHLAICAREPSRFIAESYSRLVSRIEEMATVSRSRGMAFFVVLAPDQFQVDSDLMQRLVETFELDPADYDVERPQRFLVPRLRRRRIPVFDLTRPLRRGGTDMYLLRDTHWNNRGNRVAARVIGRSLVREGLLLAGGER